MVRLTEIVPGYYGTDIERPWYVSAGSVASAGTREVPFCHGRRELTEVTTVTGEKVLVKETPEQVLERMEGRV